MEKTEIKSKRLALLDQVAIALGWPNERAKQYGKLAKLAKVSVVYTKQIFSGLGGFSSDTVQLVDAALAGNRKTRGLDLTVLQRPPTSNARATNGRRTADHQAAPKEKAAVTIPVLMVVNNQITIDLPEGFVPRKATMTQGNGELTIQLLA